MWQWRNGLLLRILSGQNSKVKEFHVEKYSPKDKNVYFGRKIHSTNLLVFWSNLKCVFWEILSEKNSNSYHRRESSQPPLEGSAELSFFSTSFNSGEYEILDLFPHTRVSFNAIFKLKATIQKMLLKNSAVLSVWISWCKIQRLNLASWC